MRLRYTKHQVPRGAFPDAESQGRIYLFKNVSFLRATYQIRLLTFRAHDTKNKLVIRVPQGCKIHPSLRDLVKEFSKAVQIERVVK
jgi:hypothetical protein